MEQARSSVYNLLEVGCVCNNAAIVDGHLRGQPTEGALLAAAMKYGMHAVCSNYIRLKEYPFTSELKIMTVQCQPRSFHGGPDNPTSIFFSKGAIEKVMQYCSKIHHQGRCLPMTSEHQRDLLITAQQLASQVPLSNCIQFESKLMKIFFRDSVCWVWPAVRRWIIWNFLAWLACTILLDPKSAKPLTSFTVRESRYSASLRIFSKNLSKNPFAVSTNI